MVTATANFDAEGDAGKKKALGVIKKGIEDKIKTLDAGMKAAEASLNKANSEKRKAAESARLKKVAEAKIADLREAKDDEALFKKIAARLALEE